MNNSYHPELKENEIFVGNHIFKDGIINIPKHLCSIKSVRIGDIAYYIDGKQIIDNNDCGYLIRPIFIDKKDSEIYDKIMTDRCKSYRKIN